MGTGQNTDTKLATVFARVCADQLALCDTLERIADSLPHGINRQACIQTARALGPLVDRAHRLEEQLLYPALVAHGVFCVDPGPTIERLKVEHAGDECFAEELTEVLLSYGEGAPTHSAEATGYMLRGFFEALRRHIAMEQAILGPVFAAIAEEEETRDQA